MTTASRTGHASSLVAAWRSVGSVLDVGEDRVDLPLALGRMRERLGVTCGVSEAGGGLNGALLRAGLVDEIQLLVLPAVVGGLGTPALFDGSQLLSGERPTSLRLLSRHAEADGMLWLRYEVLPERPAGRGADSRLPRRTAQGSRLTALDGE